MAIGGVSPTPATAPISASTEAPAAKASEMTGPMEIALANVMKGIKDVVNAAKPSDSSAAKARLADKVNAEITKSPAQQAADNAKPQSAATEAVGKASTID